MNYLNARVLSKPRNNPIFGAMTCKGFDGPAGSSMQYHGQKLSFIIMTLNRKDEGLSKKWWFLIVLVSQLLRIKPWLVVEHALVQINPLNIVSIYCIKMPLNLDKFISLDTYPPKLPSKRLHLMNLKIHMHNVSHSTLINKNNFEVFLWFSR